MAAAQAVVVELDAVLRVAADGDRLCSEIDPPGPFWRADF
jgi:hypothetical protein